MSSRRHLVSRSRQNDASTPASSSSRQQAPQGTPQAEPSIALPPYEPPSCPLTLSAKRKIDELRENRALQKYERQIKAAMKTVSESTASINDRLQERNRDVANKTRKMEKKEAVTEEEKTALKKDEAYLGTFKKQVANLTKQSDEVVRKLIDLMDENKVQDKILRDVESGIPDAPPPRQARRIGEDGQVEEEEDPVEDVEILSAVELLKTKQEEQRAKYQARSNFDRYGDHNDYRNFKQHVHDALHPEEDAPPLSKPNTWFPEDSMRRRGNRADNTNNGGEDSDDEIQVQGATTKLKCSLTLQYFEKPVRNDKCPHVFEKHAITDYYNINATDFRPPNGPPTGVRIVKCPETGCNQMLTIFDFQDDALMRRKVARTLKEQARKAREEEDDDDDAPRGQSHRPERIDDDDEDDAMDVDNVRRRPKANKFKKEMSMAPSQRMPQSESDEEEIVDMA